MEPELHSPAETAPLRRDDLELVRQALAGSTAAQERLSERLTCVTRILGALDRRLGGGLRPEEVADLSQEVLVRVWSKLGTYLGRAALETWVHRFCFLELRNWLRKSRRQDAGRSPEWLAEEPSAEPEASAEDYELLLRALDTLQPPAAAVMRLKHFEDLTFEEIGARLRIPVSTAKTSYYRGLLLLRRRLAPLLLEDPT